MRRYEHPMTHDRPDHVRSCRNRRDSFDPSPSMKKNMSSRFALPIFSSLLLSITCSAQTSEDTLLLGQNGWQTSPKVTIGETYTGWTPPGKMDGMGARRLGDTIEIFVNHELAASEAFTYTLQNGLALKGARITRFLMDVNTREIISAGLAYERIYDRTGNVVTNATKINEGTSTTSGIDRLCSASLFLADTYNLEDDLFITGEEADNGQGFVLDVENKDMHCIPWLGRAKWENAAFLQPNDSDKVAVLIGDDTQTAPLYLYIGEKDHFGNNSFLDRNGLAYGTLHVFVADNGYTTPQHVNGTGTHFTGSFQPIIHHDPALAGTSGYDLLGFAHQNTQYQLGNAIGMFHFSRPEDVATDPYDPTRAVYASTGRGNMYPADDWGTTYIIDVDFTDLSVDVQILYDGDDAGAGQFTHPDHGLRSPDNVDWGDDGSIYVQEDRATSLNTFGGVSGMEASIWHIEPQTGELTRIAMVDRSATFSDGQSDTAPGDLGNWETSGIVDVTHLFDQQDRVLLLANVMASSVQGGAIAAGSLAGGGQLVMLEGPVLTNVLLDMHAHLDGPYSNATGIMHDALRASGYIPLQHPYGNAPYIHDGTESIEPEVLEVTGNDAIVDWVLVQLRDAADPSVVLKQRAGLIQRDGDIVDTDGTSPLRFLQIPSGDHYIALRHRNHLGIMTASPHPLAPLPYALDLGSIGTQVYGTNAGKDENGVRTLWAGDVNEDGAIKYTGAGNDRDRILIEIGGIVPTDVATGYLDADVDLNGEVKYTGNGNDRDVILQNINGVVPTEQRQEQMP